MPYTVRQRFSPKIVPRNALRGLGTPTVEELAAALDAAQEAAFVTVSGETTETFNGIVTRANAIRDQLAAGGVSARLERETAETVAAFQHFTETGIDPGAPKKTSWLLIGLGLAGVGAAIWWSARARRDAELSAAIESGEMEDCGCGG